MEQLTPPSQTRTPLGGNYNSLSLTDLDAHAYWLVWHTFDSTIGYRCKRTPLIAFSWTKARCNLAPADFDSFTALTYSGVVSIDIYANKVPLHLRLIMHMVASHIDDGNME